ncbi:unnamed protein product [Prorocentrum cordatum]|uniref:Uncharacterized protein n=1 Tax=Prorocentrum cordatum TaxID=2364126 RepID=A0ABN9U5T2_9DINO|nr:unnamed protein product [Polarella glacialis]
MIVYRRSVLGRRSLPSPRAAPAGAAPQAALAARLPWAPPAGRPEAEGEVVPEVVLDQLTYTLACAAGRPAASRDALSRVLQLVAGRGARLCLRARGALPGLLRDVRAAAACAVEDGRAEEVWLVHAGILHCLALDAGGADGFLVQALPDVLEVAERRPPEGRAPGGAGGAASQRTGARRGLPREPVAL